MNVRAAALGVVVISAAFATAACDRPTAPTAVVPPSQPSPSVGAPPVTTIAIVSGVIWRHAAEGVTPYANATVWGWNQTDQAGHRIGPTTTGADGRYSFSVPIGSLLRVQTVAGYQPCVAAVAVSRNTQRDVQVIVDPAQLGAHLPAELLADTPTLSGLVVETTAAGRHPVADVRVELDMLDGMGDVSAATVTDSDGRYVLCGLSGAARTYVYASKTGYALADVGTVDLHGDTVRDIEIHR